MIKPYTHPQLTGNTCMIEEGFTAFMDLFCSLLEVHNLKAYIVSSFRKDTNVKGAIVVPAQMSNHLIGRALDVNFQDKNGNFWNSEALKHPTGDMFDFLNHCHMSGIRWGGLFTKVDSVHFDEGTNIYNPDLWAELYNQLHP